MESTSSVLNQSLRVYRQHSEAPILWPPDAKSSLNGKDPDVGID